MKIFFTIIIALIGIFLLIITSQTKKEESIPDPIVIPSPTSIPTQYIIPQQKQVYQSFNNCGPASLSMLLSYNDITISQEELGQKLRPYQNLQGDNDDKSVTVAELAEESKNYNLIPFYRPNGTIDILKLFVANNIPVLVRTWLHPDEDIGHYRIVRGYDDSTHEFIQDDSFEGENLRYSYDVFGKMWQPFNYEYMILVPESKTQIVNEIILEDVDEQIAWRHALEKAQRETAQEPDNPYPIFNQSNAYYHLGEYQKSIEAYEKIQFQLPDRMLWYQIEPIKGYVEMGRYDNVFTLTDSILNNNNRAFSELYILRGDVYERQGNKEAAQAEYEKALFYNINSQTAKDRLE